MDDPQNRRRVPRIQTRFEAMHASDRQSGSGVLTDLSDRGARLERTTAMPRLGTQVQIRALVPGHTEPLDLAGRVTRFTGDGFAIEFEKPNLAVRKLIDDAARETRLAPRPAVSSPDAKAGPRGQIRETAARCFVGGRWISGTVSLPTQRRLFETLNGKEPFLRLTGAAAEGAGEALSFLALRLSDLAFVIPSDASEIAPQGPGVGRFSARRLTFLMRGGAIKGTVEILANLRVSDYLMNATGFIAVRDCRLQMSGAGGRPGEAIELVFVNTGCVLGVSEV